MKLCGYEEVQWNLIEESFSFELWTKQGWADDQNRDLSSRDCGLLPMQSRMLCDLVIKRSIGSYFTPIFIFKFS